MKIYLVKHGITDNQKRYAIGHIDIPLNQKGREQAKATAEYLKDKGISKIFSSSLSRASQTAQIIASELELPVEEYDELMGNTAGTLDGIPVTEFIDTLKKVGDLEKMILQAGGEPPEKFKERVWNKFLEIIQHNDDHEKILIVTHGRVVQVILLTILKSPLGPGIYQGNCCINTIEYDPEREDGFLPNFMITLVNYTDHLD